MEKLIEVQDIIYRYYPGNKKVTVVNVRSGTESICIPSCIETKLYGKLIVDSWDISKNANFQTVKYISFCDSIAYIYGTCENFVNLEKVEFCCQTSGVPQNFFKGCANLKYVYLDKSSIWYIGNNAFYDCKSLKKISFPESISSFDKNAFYGCVNLQAIYFHSYKKDLIDSLVLFPNVSYISVNRKCIISLQNVYKYRQQARRQMEIEEYERKEKEKYSSFDDYYSKHISKIRFYVTLIICAIPFIILCFHLVKNTLNLFVGDFWNFLGGIVCIVMSLLFCFFSWFLATVMTFYIYYIEKEGFWSNLSFIVTVPLSVILLYIALAIFSLLSDWQLSISALFSPSLLFI